MSEEIEVNEEPDIFDAVAEFREQENGAGAEAQEEESPSVTTMPDSEVMEHLAIDTLPLRPNVIKEANEAAISLDSLRDETLKEPERSVRAFRDYIRLGKGRTLEKLAREYCKPDHSDWPNNFESDWRQLKDYSRKYNWQERLRRFVVRAAAEVLGSAQREAFVNTKDRIAASHTAYEAGLLIIQKAELDKLTAEEARKLLKPAGTLVSLGLVNERAEQGDMLGVIRPEKPIEQMSTEELDEFAMTLQKALQ